MDSKEVFRWYICWLLKLWVLKVIFLVIIIFEWVGQGEGREFFEEQIFLGFVGNSSWIVLESLAKFKGMSCMECRRSCGSGLQVFWMSFSIWFIRILADCRNVIWFVFFSVFLEQAIRSFISFIFMVVTYTYFSIFFCLEIFRFFICFMMDFFFFCRMLRSLRNSFLIFFRFIFLSVLKLFFKMLNFIRSLSISYRIVK